MKTFRTLGFRIAGEIWGALVAHDMIPSEWCEWTWTWIPPKRFQPCHGSWTEDKSLIPTSHFHSPGQGGKGSDQKLQKVFFLIAELVQRDASCSWRSWDIAGNSLFEIITGVTNCEKRNQAHCYKRGMIIILNALSKHWAEYFQRILLLNLYNPTK